MQWVLLHPRATAEHLGLIPTFLDATDPRPAKEQFQERYIWGGWMPFPGFEMVPNHGLKYPGDPAMFPLACTMLRDEKIFVYEYAWVAIVQPDDTFEVSRMD